MYKALIAVVDASRARLFTFVRVDIEEQLSERADLINPARRQRPSDLFSDSRPGSSRVGSRGFAFDDHRGDHLDHYDHAFAAAVVAELGRMADEDVRRIVLCASPNMLGVLRKLTPALERQGRAIDELPRDLTKLSASELRERLASYGLLPAQPERVASSSSRV
jgi:protein required for attachment to host cells